MAPSEDSTRRSARRSARGDRRGRSRGRPPGRPGARRAAATRRALRREAPTTVAVVAEPSGFAAMRRYATFGFDGHREYLRRTEGLLRSLDARGVHARVGLFDPPGYARFCARRGIDPDTPDSRARYAAEVAATGATVHYRGQPLRLLLPLLLEERRRRDAVEHAAGTLAGPGSCADCREQAGRAALDDAAEALERIVEAAGPGAHQLVCSVTGDAGTLVAVVHAEGAADGTARVPTAEALAFRTVLAAGLAAGRPGGVVMRTTRGERQEVRGWALQRGRLRPLSEAEVFAAYCTDARTGEPVPPEPGLVYGAGFDLSGPDEEGRVR